MVCLRETTKAFTVPRICIKLVGNGAFGVANKVSLLSQEVSSKGCYQQGCNEVRWRPEQEASLAPPCSSLRSFGSIMYCFEKRTGDIFGTSRRPPLWFGVSRSDSAPHNNSAPRELCPPCPPSLCPWLSLRTVSMSLHSQWVGAITVVVVATVTKQQRWTSESVNGWTSLSSMARILSSDSPQTTLNIKHTKRPAFKRFWYLHENDQCAFFTWKKRTFIDNIRKTLSKNVICCQHLSHRDSAKVLAIDPSPPSSLLLFRHSTNEPRRSETTARASQEKHCHAIGASCCPIFPTAAKSRVIRERTKAGNTSLFFNGQMLQHHIKNRRTQTKPYWRGQNDVNFLQQPEIFHISVTRKFLTFHSKRWEFLTPLFMFFRA